MKNRVYIRKFLAEDFNKYFKLVSNEKVMAMITEKAIPLKKAKEDYSEILINNELHKSFGYYKVIKSKTNDFIGLAKLKIKDTKTNVAEIGYMFLPEYWGNGFGNEVAKILVNNAKKEKQINMLTAIIDPSNIPSRKILINNGFTSEKICKIHGLPGEILKLKILQKENSK